MFHFAQQFTTRTRKEELTQPHSSSAFYRAKLSVARYSQLSAGYCHFGWLVGKSYLSRVCLSAL